MKKLTFEQVKQMVYDNYIEGIPEDILKEEGDEVEMFKSESIGELIDWLDSMGFNGYEAYEFLLESIIEKVLKEKTNNLEEENRILQAKILDFRNKIKEDWLELPNYKYTQEVLKQYDEYFEIKKF
jgi:IS1 family transposase